MSDSETNKEVKRPISMTRSGPNDGTAIGRLKQEIVVAKQALKAKQDTVGWDGHLVAKAEVEEAQSKSKRHSQAVEKLQASKKEMERKLEAAEEKRA